MNHAWPEEHELIIGRGGRELREWLAGRPGLEPGTSSLSGFCPQAHFSQDGTCDLGGHSSKK
jgi:hypothetical protein